MATSKKTNGGTFPEAFVSPFKRVQMTERNDDALACVATLSGRTLEEVTKLAIQLGYPKHGPAFVDNKLLTKILYNLGLTGGEYQEVPSLDALPDVAIVMIDYREEDDLGRHVVWHHVRGNDKHPSFSYFIDVAGWVPESAQVSTNWSHMKVDPAWFIEIKPRANGKGK